MADFRLDLSKTTRTFAVTNPGQPMGAENASGPAAWFMPAEADITTSAGQVVEVEFIGNPCARDGRPLTGNYGYGRRHFDYQYLQRNRPLWPPLLRDLVEHVEQLDAGQE